MKINIELDLSTEEIPLAKDIVNLLYQLTSQYKNGLSKFDMSITRETFKEVLNLLQEGKSPEQVAQEINTLVPQAETPQIEMLYSEVEAVVFNPELANSVERIVPFFAVILRYVDE
jgi:uncharacterized protein YktA (UPF0223 family)